MRHKQISFVFIFTVCDFPAHVIVFFCWPFHVRSSTNRQKRNFRLGKTDVCRCNNRKEDEGGKKDTKERKKGGGKQL